jgi:hypothetical protein
MASPVMNWGDVSPREKASIPALPSVTTSPTDNTNAEMVKKIDELVSITRQILAVLQELQ